MASSSTSLATPPPARRISYEEFLADESEEHAEWVDGEVVPMMSVTYPHSATTNYINAMFTLFATHFGLGEVLGEPFNMKTGPSLPGRSPDVMFVKSANRDRIQEKFLDGPADIVVEVLSTISAGRDRGDKYLEYETGGVPEYWLIDPVRQVAEFYLLGPTGRYELARTEDGVFRSTQMPGLAVRLEWLWERPSFLDIAEELGLR